jgi:cytochrome b561
MNTFAKVRQWINKNDGKYFQVENVHYSLPHALGLLILIPGFLIAASMLPQAIQSPPPVWSGWVIIAVGAAFIVLGNLPRKK